MPSPPLPRLTPAFLRAQTVGIDALVPTPFGPRPLVYADFTASGRQLAFVEDYLRALAVRYANAHTEDSLTGRTATRLLHEAEASIKRSVGAGPGGKVVSVGAGSTAAIHKLQEFLGVAIPPVTLHALMGWARTALGEAGADAIVREIAARRPVVFVGPYEHHSNEVTWREGVCDVVEVDLAADGGLDLSHLDRLLSDPAYVGRTLVGSFSAASNVTGVTCDVHAVARLLHARGALAFVDYAAGGPYLPIDMSASGDAAAALDAVFLSPHKFLGGPGSCGLLVFHEDLYRTDLAPSVGGGGTVDYVGPSGHDFTADIEARETAGTPGFFQTLRAALALQVKDALGSVVEREHALLERAFAAWAETGRIDVLGPAEPDRRVGIVSFNVTCGAAGRVLHPRFVTVLLNDLFGIQSRAGCSCAGPYGHRLLGITGDTAERYRTAVRSGAHGVKPGWCRVGFHPTMDDAEADYLISAVAFVAHSGERFLPLYTFSVETGTWTHRDAPPDAAEALSLTAALAAPPPVQMPVTDDVRHARYATALADAASLADALADAPATGCLDDTLADLQFFAMA
ncbi:MAG TPA: aminotransferase class V-fold PLP-dependent enzyme [Rubricoccaceae bacterium]|jgi:selenocysteine lyase/cysteine desulfurase